MYSFYNSTGHTRGFGFVTFTTVEAANAALERGRNQELDGKTIEIKRAEPRPTGGKGDLQRVGMLYPV